nr:TIGR04190 family B12-binding domain/radical SAM domain protein [Chloroflexota bacterium]
MVFFNSQADLIFLHAPSVYDFRQRAILYGPISDVVPSNPVFEMYPIGLTTMAEYLERHGYRVRIVNLAVRMLDDPDFDAEQLIARLNPRAFGIDLHWLLHAHGALAVADLVKRHHPHTPVIFGGFSATYYQRELIQYPQVDYVIRGDSAEEPLRQLLECLNDGRSLAQVPNLTWQDGAGQVQENPLTYSPENLDHVTMDYSYVVRAVARSLGFDLKNYKPLAGWFDYPIMAALTCRGCTKQCLTCGGSAQAFRQMHNRERPAYRDPEQLARDLWSMAEVTRGPIFVLGDLQQAGMAYTERFLKAVRGFPNPVMLELFDVASDGYLQKVGQTFSDWTLEISPETHDPAVRRAFGKTYDNETLESTLATALDAGCSRLDLFFMTGLPQQTVESVLGTAGYCRQLMARFDDNRLLPFISPLAPFLDPGSRAFENPERYGYRLFCRTLEEHRQALEAPTWKHTLNYETAWMSRAEIVDSTYEAGLELTRLKAARGMLSEAVAQDIEDRVARARRLMAEIDHLLETCTPQELQQELARLKPEMDSSNTSTVCDKRELE